MSRSYRGHFIGERAGVEYDASQYADGSYWERIWTLERKVLDEVVADVRGRVGRIEYLDFACGTGRVLAHVEKACGAATGIDVSAEMLAEASRRVARAALIRTDITSPDAAIEGQYDLITAFRFILNAEDDLRLSGLAALRRRLRNRDSRLVVNCHGNLMSYKALVAPAHAVIRKFRGERTGYLENVLTPGRVRALVRDAGLEIVREYGIGVIPGRASNALPASAAMRLEERFMRSSLARFGVDQIYVCRMAAVS